MCEYPYNHGALLDGGDDLQGAATLRAMFDIDIEHGKVKGVKQSKRGQRFTL